MDTLDLPPLCIQSALLESPCGVVSQLVDVAESAGVKVVSEVSSAAVLTLEFCDGALQLTDRSEAKSKGVKVDFLSAQSEYRRTSGGGAKESIAKAVGLKTGANLTIVDATPGLGRDAYVLAALGATITLIERSPVIYLLLFDGLRRLAMAEPELASRLTLKFGNSANVMLQMPESSADVVYLDPMFPHKKKSALVKRDMRMVQQMVGSDDDASALLPAAKHAAKLRVVVKRPNYAPNLTEETPFMVMSSKKHRFDVYMNFN